MAEMIQQALAAQLGQIGQAIEDQVDAEIHRMENMDEDNLEKLREKRIDHMKRMQKKQQEWRAAGHGEVRLIDGDKVRQARTRARRAVARAAGATRTGAIAPVPSRGACRGAR